MRVLVTIAAVTALLGGCSSSSHDEHAPAPAPTQGPAPVKLPEVDGVPALEDENPDPNIVEVTLSAQRTTVEYEGKQVPMLGYNGIVPGPMLKAKVGDEVIVHFHNDLS